MLIAAAERLGEAPRLDTAIQLVAEAGDTEAAIQAAALRRFARRALTRRYPRLAGMTDVDTVADLVPAMEGKTAEAAARRGMAPVDPPHTMIVFDVPSLLRAAPWRSRALLAPASVAAALARSWPGLLADERDNPWLDQAARLQVALRHAAVVVFHEAQSQALTQLGGQVQALPWPAMAPDNLPPLLADVAIIDQGSEAAWLGAVRRALRNALPMADIVEADATLAGPGSEAVARLVLPARVHVHVGSPRAALSRWRVIDSLAAGRLVVQVAPPPPSASAKPPGGAADDLEGRQMAVQPMRTGLLAAADPRGGAEAAQAVADAVLRAMGDVAAADVFARGALRAVEDFNRVIEDTIWEPAR